MKSSMGMLSGNQTPVSVLNYIAGGNHPPSALGTQASAEISRAWSRVMPRQLPITLSYFVLTAQSELQHFRQMQRLAARRLENLFPAAETVGNNQRVRGRVAYGGKQYSFAHRLRHLVLVFLEAKRPGHSAASGIDGLQI